MTAMKPPGWPPALVEALSWIEAEMQPSSPDSAKTMSPGLRLISKTGRMVPMILCSMRLPPGRGARG